MDNSTMMILKEYCESQGIALRNMDEVASELEDVLDRVIANVVHEVGDFIRQGDEE